MKRFILISLFTPFLLNCNGQDLSGKLIALYQFPVEIEIQNDQGEMGTKEYLKEYGTKGKTRALETLYELLVPFVQEEFEKEGLDMISCDELKLIRANPYGVPTMALGKAVKSCEEADYFLRIALKDITVINPHAPQSGLAVKMRRITIRCRITLDDRDKNTVKHIEATFDSGETIDKNRNIGIDLRKITGTERDQELKIYEACCKMAFLRAMDQW